MTELTAHQKAWITRHAAAKAVPYQSGFGGNAGEHRTGYLSRGQWHYGYKPKSIKTDDLHCLCGCGEVYSEFGEPAYQEGHENRRDDRSRRALGERDITYPTAKTPLPPALAAEAVGPEPKVTA